jgi:hypothetical protein
MQIQKLSDAPDGWDSNHRYVRIDRRTGFGNPFVVGKDGTREEVIAKYRVWLWQRIKHGGSLAKTIVDELREDSILLCHCAPLKCHGEVLESAWKWLMNYPVK